MNLIIDIGNTFVKLAVFQSDKLFYRQIIEKKGLLENVEQIKNKFPEVKQAIISSVAHLSNTEWDVLKKQFKLLLLSPSVLLPFTNNYGTPKTLGVDRIALVSAAVNQYPNKNVLVVDVGTCITYDFVTSALVYLGGAISPGLQMRYRALHTFTSKLPLLEIESPNYIIGGNTNQSIHSGVINGTVNEIEGFIERYKQKYSDLTVILTGGDSNFLAEQLKSSIFVNSNFLLEGLNFILKYNS
ncbi:MAG: type III pantothenate kinase [Aestuariibaculum sp.]